MRCEACNSLLVSKQEKQEGLCKDCVTASETYYLDTEIQQDESDLQELQKRLSQKQSLQIY